MTRVHFIAASLGGLLLSACSSMDVGAPSGVGVTISNERVTVNPSGFAPLTAVIHVETSAPTKVSLTVPGKHGAASDVAKDFDDVATTHDLPVLGLYADVENAVQCIFRNAGGAEVSRKTYVIRTAQLPAGTFPAIAIDTRKDGQLAAGMTLVSYFGYQLTSFPQTPFIFDAYGDIRWYLDYRLSVPLGSLFFDDGVARLQNGNLYFGDVKSNAIYEVDMLGRIVDSWPLPGFQFHHNVQEKPNGNFLVTVTKQGISTTEDFIIELDRATRLVVRTWDLRASLQAGRLVMTTDAVDWIHVNAVTYDASDNTIIVSGRTQALVKLDANNRVVWILGAHKGWGTAGNGTALGQFLLQPVDRNDQPITDQRVLDGDAIHPDFEWPWYQHAPLVMPSGHVLLFDNGGDNRNFSGRGQYSRAVEYDISATKKTVKQVWTYGKDRGVSIFSNIVSNVEYLAASNHLIVSPGAANTGTKYGKVIEMDYATQEVVFEATLTPPQTYFGITFHRTRRLSLYP